MINCLRSLKYRLARKSLKTLYCSFILPIFDYCDQIWNNCTKTQELMLEKLHLDALRTICGAVKGTNHEKIYMETGFTPLSTRRYYHKLYLFYKMNNNLTPEYLTELIPSTIFHLSQYETRK